MENIGYHSQTAEITAKLVAYGFQTKIHDYGKLEVEGWSGIFHTAPEYKVSSILIAEGEILTIEEKPKATSSLESLREYERFSILERARKYYEMNKEELLKIYERKYIAILDERIVDFDDDFATLANRIYNNYGYITIYMTRVEKYNNIVNIPSPTIKK